VDILSDGDINCDKGDAELLVGQDCDFFCDLGFEPVTSFVTCTAAGPLVGQGVWSANPDCTPIVDYCEPQTYLQYGSINCNNGDPALQIYNNCFFTCDYGWTSSLPSYNITCQSNTTTSGQWSDTPTCIDVDECLGNPCAEMYECVNTYGSYVCGPHVFAADDLVLTDTTGGEEISATVVIPAANASNFTLLRPYYTGEFELELENFATETTPVRIECQSYSYTSSGAGVWTVSCFSDPGYGKNLSLQVALVCTFVLYLSLCLGSLEFD
jgi:hypothetical protein